MAPVIRSCPWCGGYYRDRTHCERDEQPLVDSDGMIDRYRIVDRLGEGGMGVVYRAEHLLLENRVVALKLLHRELSRDRALVTRFFREARAASRVENDHIVKVVDFGATAAGDSFLVMEFLQGRSLRERIDAEAPLPLETAFSIGVQIAEGLYAAHRKGIVHRDLKPENVLLVAGPAGGEEVAKLVDFGIAQLNDHQDARITRAGMILGTPAYMSPEQASGERVDQRADIYALGTILYEMLVGRCPFTGGNAKEVLLAQLTQQPLPPKQIRADIPSSVQQVILHALHKEADQRPRTMMYLAYELRDALTRQTGACSAIDAPEPLREPGSPRDGNAAPRSLLMVAVASLRRYRRLLWLGGVAGGMLLGIVVTLMIVRHSGEQPRAGRPAVQPPGGSSTAEPDAASSRSRARPRPAAQKPPLSTAAPVAAAASAPAEVRARAPSKTPRRRSAAARTAVRIVSVPAGATVMEGTRTLGKTPLDIPTERARSVYVFAPGHSERGVRLARRQGGTVRVQLRKQAMSWEVLSLRQLAKMRDSGQISSFTHDRRRRELMQKRDAELRRLRIDHKLGHYTKQQYDRQVKAIRDSYR